MTNIVVKIIDGKATAELTGILTTGMVGVPVTFDLGEEWESLSVIAVFRGSEVTIDRPLLGTRETTVPHEVLAKVGERICIGAEGRNAAGDLIIASNMAEVEDSVRQGADPSGDESIDPTQPIWAEIMDVVDDLVEKCADQESVIAEVEFHNADPEAHDYLQQQILGVADALEQKVNTADIVDDLTTENAEKPLSAKQGVVLKEIINSTSTMLNVNIAKCAKTVNGVAVDSYGNISLDVYSKAEIDTIMGAYVDDIDTLVGGDS